MSTVADDPLVAAYRREGELLRRHWALQCARRRQGLARDYNARVCINRALLLRARLAQTADEAKRRKIAQTALVGAR